MNDKVIFLKMNDKVIFLKMNDSVILISAKKWMEDPRVGGVGLGLGRIFLD